LEEINQLKREGLSILAISNLTGHDRKTIRKYLDEPVQTPCYEARPAAASKLDPFKEYLKQRLSAGVWNGRVLLRELRERNYAGSYTILTDWLRPQRQAAAVIAVRRFETAPGQQVQADWGHLGWITNEGQRKQIWGFAMTHGYSRKITAEAALDQKLPTLLRMHERAFSEWGGVPEEILYDRMKTIWTGVDERGEIIWNPVFLDFSRYWGFHPRLCRPYRAQTKGKIESGIKYVRRNFVCGLQGREPSGLEDFNAELRRWVAEVADRRVHGTTHEQVLVRWQQDREQLKRVDGLPSYPFADDEERRVARDAYVSWRGARYSVPWTYAGKDVYVREHNGAVEMRYGSESIALHPAACRRHETITQPDHHRGIPLGAVRNGKTLLNIVQDAPLVEQRPLDAYEAVAIGGAR
jgi:transposase